MEMPKVTFDLKIVPEIVIYIGDKPLGRISFSDLETMNIFIKDLRESVGELIEKYQNKEEKIVKP